MIGWIILAVYVVGVFGFWVTISRFMESDMPSSSTMDRVIIVSLAFIVAWLWPLVIPGGWAYRRVYGRKGKS